MSNVSAKKLSTVSVKVLHDLLLAHFNNHPQDVPADLEPASHVQTVLGMKLTEIGYERASTLPAVIRSHNAAVQRGQARYLADAADEHVAELFSLIANVALERTAVAEDDANTDTEITAPVAAPALAPVNRAARAGACFVVADGAATTLNPTLSAVTGGSQSDIGNLLNFLMDAETRAEEMRQMAAAYGEVIAAYQGGATEVDESTLQDPAPWKASGLSAVPPSSPMLPVLDALLAQAVTPAITYGGILVRLNAAENEIVEATKQVKALARDLRRVRPKARIAVATTSAPAALAESLSEIDEINADCSVVMETAADLFPRIYGGNAKILSFEVPRLDFGVQHPDVPQIDETFRFYTGVLVEVLSAIADNEIVWLHGESGCGKSELCAQVAAHLNMPFSRINLDGHLTRTDIVGGMKMVSDGRGGMETRFIEGALPRAMSRPGFLLIDEFDAGDPEIMPIFQPVLEGKPLVLLEDGGRIVHPHPQFRIILTGNTVGLGSENQMYNNVHEQSAATRDRIAAFVKVDYMPPDIEKDVVLARMPDADEGFVTKLIQLANKVREGYRAQEVHTLFSTRAVLACVRRHNRFAPLYPTPEQASDEILRAVILNRLDEASHQVVRGFIDNIFV